MFCLLLQKFGTIVVTRQKVKEIRDYLGDPPVHLPRPKNSPRGCFCPAGRGTRGLGCSIPARVTFYARHLLKSVYKEKSTTSNEVVLFGDPYGNRTSIILQISFNAIRTNDNFITGMDFIKGYFYICVVQSVVLFI